MLVDLMMDTLKLTNHLRINYFPNENIKFIYLKISCLFPGSFCYLSSILAADERF